MATSGILLVLALILAVQILGATGCKADHPENQDHVASDGQNKALPVERKTPALEANQLEDLEPGLDQGSSPKHSKRRAVVNFPEHYAGTEIEDGPRTDVLVLPDLFGSPMGRNVVGGGGSGIPSIPDVLEHGLALVGLSPVHLVLRGTGADNSVRCEWRGVARTLDQREEEIRFWYGLGKSDPLPSPVDAETCLHCGD